MDSEEEIKTTTEDTFTQAQTPVKYNVPDSFPLRQKLNVKMPQKKFRIISDCIKTVDKLVLADNEQNRLIVCNADGTDKKHMPLPYRPCYITEVDSNTEAVSCTIARTILIVNISTGFVNRKIKTNGLCYGTSYDDNNLYVVIDMNMIHVMNLTGKVIRTLPLPSYSIVDITADRDRLVCIDNTSIYCCSLNGKLIWKFENEKYHALRCFTTDGEGNVYVTNKDTNTVVVVFNDGKHCREILTNSDGLNKPCGIYIEKKENILLVCNYVDGNVFLFDVIKKHIRNSIKKNVFVEIVICLYSD